MKKFLILFLIIQSGILYSQEISCDDPAIADAYNLAVNTVKINVRRGILTAGGDYGGEWTRDISINSWNGASLLLPRVAEKSLWSVTIDKDSIGHQYWDRIIWVIAALNHFNVTGDIEFLEQAYRCSVNSMKELEQSAFDPRYGLFTGPSVFNDGIAAYPEPIFDKNVNSSFVLDHKNSFQIKCLSTNCIYYGAYCALAEMGKLLGSDPAALREYREKSDALKSNILKYLYSEKENKLYYLINNQGDIDKSQEGLGLSFAVIFGILDKEQACKLIRNASVSKYGITSVYPDFPRYSHEQPGRHNNIIWPMVNGFFAQASIVAGDTASFGRELNALTHLALDEDKGNYQFWEIYNPYTGIPDGGWQDGTHWKSCRLQTWSATAYINMVLYGLAGLRIEENGIVFSPYLPGNIHFLELKNIPYQHSILDITLRGNGTKIKSFIIDGKKLVKNKIDKKLAGHHAIQINLEP